MKKLYLIFLSALLIGLSISHNTGFKKALRTNDKFKQEIEQETLANNPPPECEICDYYPKDEQYDCPESVKSNVPEEYIKYFDRTEILKMPQPIDDPQVVKMSEVFDEKEFEEGLYKIGSDKGWWSSSFDVDGDGEDEIVISASVAMTQTPHIAMIVKNGNIIFKAGGAGIGIQEVFDHKGFFLSQKGDWMTKGEIITTLYIYEDESFIPIWTQKSCHVKFE